MSAALGAMPVCDGVCVVPPDRAFRTADTEAAVRDARATFRVVVFAEVGADKGAWASATERATEETWEAWASAPSFSPSEDVLVVLALDDREVRVKTGSRWDADYGLWGDAVLP